MTKIIRQRLHNPWKSVLAYYDLLPTSLHQAGKDQTQSIERKHLDLRTRIKRLARRTICFSKSELMHDTVIELATFDWRLSLDRFGDKLQFDHD